MRNAGHCGSRPCDSQSLQGKGVTLDAGLLTREVAQTILEKGVAYLGLLKGNHGEVTTAVAYWLEMQLGTAPPDYFVVMSAVNAAP